MLLLISVFFVVVFGLGGIHFLRSALLNRGYLLQKPLAQSLDRLFGRQITRVAFFAMGCFGLYIAVTSAYSLLGYVTT